MIQPRDWDYETFIKATTSEYLLGSYRLSLAQARAAAQQEWDLRQEFEQEFGSIKRGAKKSHSDVKGFGQNSLGSLKTKEEAVRHTSGQVVFSLNLAVLETCRTDNRRYLSVKDINSLFCGDERFLVEYARLVQFPKFSPRANGFARWQVGEWVTKHGKKGKVKIVIK